MSGTPKNNRRKQNETPNHGAIWHVDEEAGLFIGPLERNKRHCHAVPVYFSGVYDAIALRIGDQKWQTCRAAIIPAGTPYEFSAQGAPVAVIYLEPTIANADSMQNFITKTKECGGALIGVPKEGTIFRELFEDKSSSNWVNLALSEMINSVLNQSPAQIDPRIKSAITKLQQNHAELTPVTKLADAVNLSPSRFQHLFSQTVGVPFRRYRAWQRMRSAIREISRGSNFTTASHAAGFSDQSHFYRDFAKMFGATPTKGLRLRQSKPS